jgi:hypothetical protein
MAGAFRGQAQNGGAFAQAQSPSEKLRERDYLERTPPVVTDQRTLGDVQSEAFEAYLKPRLDVLKAIGIPPHEARTLIETMPDAVDEKRRLGQEGQADPLMQERVKKLLDRMR